MTKKLGRNAAYAEMRKLVADGKAYVCVQKRNYHSYDPKMGNEALRIAPEKLRASNTVLAVADDDDSIRFAVATGFINKSIPYIVYVHCCDATIVNPLTDIFNIAYEENKHLLIRGMSAPNGLSRYDSRSYEIGVALEQMVKDHYYDSSFSDTQMQWMRHQIEKSIEAELVGTVKDGKYEGELPKKGRRLNIVRNSRISTNKLKLLNKLTFGAVASFFNAADMKNMYWCFGCLPKTVKVTNYDADDEALKSLLDKHTDVLRLWCSRLGVPYDRLDRATSISSREFHIAVDNGIESDIRALIAGVPVDDILI